MTRDERLAAGERILRAIFAVRAPEMDARDVARHVINVAFPDLAAGTHWIAPREATNEMAKAFLSIESSVPDDPRAGPTMNQVWSAARDAYLKQEGGKP